MDKYQAAIGMFPKINTGFWQKITAYFKNYQDAWEASSSDLIQAGISEKASYDFAKFKQNVDPDIILDRYKSFGIRIISISDEEYPEKLKEIFNPPSVLYVCGIMPKMDISIAVVGARKCSDYGRRVTNDITSGLAVAKVTIISGLALGLDTEAHKAALQNNGITIAVLANGLDTIYPVSNTVLAKEILKTGTLISEQPIGMPALKPNFPARNRIISGLADGVLITEAGEHSGTLYTANFALEQNRNVYAVPGPIYNDMAKGPNNLIKNGAKPVSTASDILEDFGVEKIEKIAIPENDAEIKIFEILAAEPKHIDVINLEFGRSIPETSQTLSMMELKGKVRHLGGMVYTLKR